MRRRTPACSEAANNAPMTVRVNALGAAWRPRECNHIVPPAARHATTRGPIRPVAPVTRTLIGYLSGKTIRDRTRAAMPTRQGCSDQSVSPTRVVTDQEGGPLHGNDSSDASATTSQDESGCAIASGPATRPLPGELPSLSAALLRAPRFRTDFGCEDIGCLRSVAALAAARTVAL